VSVSIVILSERSELGIYCPLLVACFG